MENALDGIYLDLLRSEIAQKLIDGLLEVRARTTLAPDHFGELGTKIFEKKLFQFCPKECLQMVLRDECHLVHQCSTLSFQD